MPVLPFFLVETPPHSQFDPALYPRDYRVFSGYRRFFGILGGIAIAGGCLAIWLLLTHSDSPSLGGNTFGVANADAIAVEDVCTHKTLLRSNIAGRRVLRVPYVSTPVLMPGVPGEKKLKICMSLPTDAAFTVWLSDFPDLDEAQLAESRKQVAVDPHTGFSCKLRAQQIASAQTSGNPLNALAGVSIFWALLFPRPYLPLMLFLMLLPIIAHVVLVRSRGIDQVEGRRNDAPPSLDLALIFPGMALWLATIRNYHLMDWKATLYPGFAIAIAMTVVMALSDPAPQKRRLVLLPFLIFNVWYGYALTGETKRLLNRSRAQRFRVTVFGQYVSHGNKPSYTLRLDPWGPQRDVSRISVPQAFYDSIPLAGSVCADLHSRDWHIPWLVVNPCS